MTPEEAAAHPWVVGTVVLYTPIPGHTQGAVVLTPPQRSGPKDCTVRLGGLAMGYTRGAFRTHSGFIIATTSYLQSAPTIFLNGVWTVIPPFMPGAHSDEPWFAACVWFEHRVQPETRLKGWHWRALLKSGAAPSYEKAIARVESEIQREIASPPSATRVRTHGR